jgi:hypothetical protein
VLNRPTREDPLIKLFLSAYEHGSWADAATSKPDAVERRKPAVDQVATRKSDAKTLAIEHTIIEPFVGDKEDFASFRQAFLAIEEDESLLVPGRWIQVFVPVGTLYMRPQELRRTIVKSVHRWIGLHRLILPDGESRHTCPITEIAGRPPFDITLAIKAEVLQGGPIAERGSLHIRRQEVGNSFGNVVEKTLEKKLPKLVNTAVEKRILMLERQHMNLSLQRMLEEIEQRRRSFPDLARVDEIWIVETIFYGTAFGGTYLRFERYEGGYMVGMFDFQDGKLMTRVEDGVCEIVRRFADSSTQPYT